MLVTLDGSEQGRDTQKTQHGIETRPGVTSGIKFVCRDTQKTQHGIETYR